MNLNSGTGGFGDGVTREYAAFQQMLDTVPVAGVREPAEQDELRRLIHKYRDLAREILEALDAAPGPD